MTHIFQNSLHERDSDFSLLHEIVLGILDFETGLLLSGRAGTLEPINTKTSISKGSETHSGGVYIKRQRHVRLLRRIQLQPAHPHSLPRLHSNRDRRIQRRLPRVQEVLLHAVVLLQTRCGDLVPAAGVQLEGPAQALRLTCRARGHRSGGGVRSPCERVWEGLVLGGGRRGGRGGRGEVRALEVGRGEGGDVVPDGGRELRE